jgi:hypothetical protein
MRTTLIILAMAASATLSVVESRQNAAPPQDQPAAAPVRGGLSDLEALTRSCSMAALNAAARQAADVPTQGKYQFSYFNLISDSHHAQYEVHFKSNYEGESDLKYCVEIYCQQGWDPKAAKATITPMNDPPKRAPARSQRTGCGQMQMPAKRQPRR